MVLRNFSSWFLSCLVVFLDATIPYVFSHPREWRTFRCVIPGSPCSQDAEKSILCARIFPDYTIIGAMRGYRNAHVRSVGIAKKGTICRKISGSFPVQTCFSFCTDAKGSRDLRKGSLFRVTDRNPVLFCRLCHLEADRKDPLFISQRFIGGNL